MLFVADLTVNHLGNLNLALRMVERASWAGCDYVKFQKKDVSTFYTQQELARPFRDTPYGKTWGEYRSMLEFSREDFDRLDWRCRELSTPWFATVYDLPSLEFMLKYNLPLYKVASAKARDMAFLRTMAEMVPRDKSIVLSVGGSTLAEIEAALSLFPHKIYLLHCVSEYPCPPESLRLGNIIVLQARFGRVSIGYSGHEVGFVPTLAAVGLGAQMVERHLALSRHSFVHHIECALEPQEYRAMVLTVKSGRPLYAPLPDASFETRFGMSRAERAFLVQHKYLYHPRRKVER